MTKKCLRKLTEFLVTWKMSQENSQHFFLRGKQRFSQHEDQGIFYTHAHTHERLARKKENSELTNTAMLFQRISTENDDRK